VSPGQGNTASNSQFVTRLRQGDFDTPALFSLAQDSDVVPGLTINATTGVLSGVPSAAGFFQIGISRQRAGASASSSFGLLVGSSDGVFIVPASKTLQLVGQHRSQAPCESMVVSPLKASISRYRRHSKVGSRSMQTLATTAMGCRSFLSMPLTFIPQRLMETAIRHCKLKATPRDSRSGGRWLRRISNTSSKVHPTSLIGDQRM